MKNNKKVIITGGGGGIGRELANYLVDFSYLDITILDNNVKGSMDKRINVVGCDLAVEEISPEIEKIFYDSDYIFHLACIKPSERGTTKEEFLKNIKMTKNVAKFNKKSKIIYTSAGTIYGICDKFPIKEDEEVKCGITDWYCRGKLESENILREYSKKNKWKLVLLRITNIYGIDFRRNGEILSNFFESIIDDKSLDIYGSGKQKRDRIFIDDLVRALVFSLRDDIVGIFNIGSGKSYSTLKVAKMIGKILKRKYKIEFLDSENNGRKDNLLDIKKAKSILKFKPIVSFKKGLEVVINNWENERRNK